MENFKHTNREENILSPRAKSQLWFPPPRGLSFAFEPLPNSLSSVTEAAEGTG